MLCIRINSNNYWMASSEVIVYIVYYIECILLPLYFLEVVLESVVYSYTIL